MGPQPFGCGRYAATSPCVVIYRPLQWGRNLSVAEGSQMRRQACPFPRLQWGRNLSVAEGAPCHANGTPARHASMGPQPFGCGRSLRIRIRCPAMIELQWGRNLSVAEGAPALGPARQVGGASMGPQPFGCGRCIQVDYDYLLYRRFNGAATFRLRKVPTESISLWSTTCFNGAATFRLRKGQRRRLQWRPSALQWGRNLSVAEGFCTAALSARRNRFNGAATFRLRKERTGIVAPQVLPLLQWGRNLSVAEGALRPSCRQWIKRLQWGRNLSVAEGPEVLTWTTP